LVHEYGGIWTQVCDHSPGSPFKLLTLTMLSQDLTCSTVDTNTSNAARLGRLEGVAPYAAHVCLLDSDHTSVEVNVTPVEAKRLPTTAPDSEKKPPECPQAIIRDETQEGAQLLPCPSGSSFTIPSSDTPRALRGISIKEPILNRIVQRLGEGPNGVHRRSRR
jgi:hypothetical protein